MSVILTRSPDGTWTVPLAAPRSMSRFTASWRTMEVGEAAPGDPGALALRLGQVTEQGAVEA